MNTPKFARIALDNPLRTLFDYRIPAHLSAQLVPGCRVWVPFGKRRLIGIFIQFTQHSDIPSKKLKSLQQVIDEPPVFDPQILALLTWAAGYYHYSLGAALFTALPPALRKAETRAQLSHSCWLINSLPDSALQRAPKQQAIYAWCQQQQQATIAHDQLKQQFPDSQSALKALSDKGYLTRQEIALPMSPPACVDSQALTLSNAQAQLSEQLQRQLEHFNTTLLEGVTGSGKTEVYFSVMETVLRAPASQILILVPEIGLTPQLLARVEKQFSCEIGVLHSNMSDQQRVSTWLKISRGRLRIVIGTRLAVFTPMPQLKLIIIDEEHDASFKQQEGFVYHARDVAIYRAKQADIPIILGSATPSFESLHNVRSNKFHHLRLTQRAQAGQLPVIHTCDMRNQPAAAILSSTLTRAMQHHLAQNKQVILFLNRRGYAPTLFCHDCGWIARCPRCDANLTYHATRASLYCHHCDTQAPKPDLCGDCQSSNLILLGHGTQRIEHVLQQQFADYSCIRLDRDSTRSKGSMESILHDIHSHKYQIIIGTQLLAKGHDFPDVSLVGILDIDYGIYSADFRAMERSAQLLIQVAGRAGRRQTQGEVYVQTYNPDHPLLNLLIKTDYAQYAQQALKIRADYQLPPYSYHMALRARATDSQNVHTFLNQAKSIAADYLPAQISIQGPIIPVMEKKAGQYRAFLLLIRPQRGMLSEQIQHWIDQISTLPAARRVHWTIDVDPIDAH